MTTFYLHLPTFYLPHSLHLFPPCHVVIAITVTRSTLHHAISGPVTVIVVICVWYCCSPTHHFPVTPAFPAILLLFTLTRLIDFVVDYVPYVRSFGIFVDLTVRYVYFDFRLLLLRFPV